ncbi:MAG: DNA mismatch repair protein MutS [Candidatus Thorarchaeota archaeon]|nr:DNA mismatch repair protein MutS [Candidatus Thorarchaeota archaeon]
MTKQTPMQRQYLQLKRQYPDCILMFRLGDFYEMFNEDAKVASKALDIVLTARGEGVNRWPLCGVPYHAVDGYVAKLLQQGFTVAVAEQVEDPSQAKGLVKRDVVRVITPGTVLESSMLEDSSNNYLTAMIEEGGITGVASVDVSTGEFLAAQIEGSLDSEAVMNEIGRLGPSEILLPDGLAKSSICKVLQETGIHITLRNALDFSASNAEDLLKEQYGVSIIDGFGIADKQIALGAVGAVLVYLQDVHRTSKISLSGLRTYTVETHMVVDSQTQRNLELIKNARDGTPRGTLLSILSKTVTPMGKRKLKQWILQPLRDVAAIEMRLDAVEELARNALIRQGIASSLRDVGDLERATSRIVFGTSSARDLLGLRNSLSRLPASKEALASCSSKMMRDSANSIDPLTELHLTLKEAILDDPPVSVRDGGMIKKGFSRDLDSLKETISSDKKWIASLQETERRRTGIKSLKVGFNKVFGYYIEITRSNLNMVPEEYERKQTLANAERFITPELKEKESAVLAGEERINKLEFEIYEELRERVREASAKLRQNSNAIAITDVLVSLSEVAVTRRYCRPSLKTDTRIKIVDGRHASLEVMLGPNEFVPNSIEIGDGGTTLIIITGPNMAGKSTWMRQCAIIVLLAQMGSFVPAKSAEVGLVDRIFTRVGAFDDLTARQSTFMVEMIETANILNNATEKSLVILDEIGRGTSTFDGMALAWAVAERIIQMRTRTLFATHFHQLTDMAAQFHGVKNVHTLAKESGDTIIFIHRVVDGGTDKSYGVHVAALAGVPESVVKRASQILQKIEKENRLTVRDTIPDFKSTEQTSLESLVIEDPLVDRIRHIDLDRTTPIDALMQLREIQEEAKKRKD